MGNNLKTTQTKRGNIIQFQRKPFAEGSFRYAFQGTIISGPDKGQKAVVKAFKDKAIRKLPANQVQKELQVYKCTNMYAKQFNLKCSNIGIQQRITVPQPDIVYVTTSFWEFLYQNGYFTHYDTICVEKYLKGKYIKWTNNAGFVNKGAEGIEVIEAFQHYTYVKSSGNIICCDIQGVKNGLTFYITDPAVISRQRIYGDTDLGMGFLKQILGRHKCNQLCKKLGMENYLYDKDLKPIEYSYSKRRSHSHGI